MEGIVRQNGKRNLKTFIAMLRDVFDAIDTDGNGSLSRAEVSTFERQALADTDEQRVAIFLSRNFEFLSSISYIRAHTATGEITREDIKFLQALFSPRELERLICSNGGDLDSMYNFTCSHSAATTARS